ncbi:hypothetical protein Tco_0760398 [Tanacetum coccineum]
MGTPGIASVSGSDVRSVPHKPSRREGLVESGISSCCSFQCKNNKREDEQSHFCQQNKFTKTYLAVHNIKQKEGEITRAFVIRTRRLVEFLSTNLPSTYKALMEKPYTWIEAKEVATNGAPVEYMEGFDRPVRNTSWGNSRNKSKSRDRFTLYNKDPNHGILGNLVKSLREILATKKAAKAFSPPPRMTTRGKNRDTSKYCHFHDDHGHDKDYCRKLNSQIEEA